jgi:hypothetical protein
MAIPNPKNPGHISEFQYDPALAHWLGDSCGDSMAEHMAAMADGRLATVVDMLDIYNDLYKRNIAHHRELGKGGSTMSQQAMELERKGYKVALHMPYAKQFTADWLGTLRTWAGKKPIGLFFTNGQALVDAQTGIGYSWRKPWIFDPTHPLSGHFIAVVDKCERGYICCDGANPQANQRYQLYRADTLAKAAVHGLLMIDMKGPQVLYTVGTDGNLIYPNGKLLGGFSAFVKEKGITADLDIPDTSFSPTESFCSFKDGRVLYWSAATGVLDMGNCGRIVGSMWKRPVQVVKPDLSRLNDALSHAAQFIMDAQSEAKKVA